MRIHALVVVVRGKVGWRHDLRPAIALAHGQRDEHGTGTITATGDITAYSDASLKTDVATISNALNLVKSLRGVSFTRIETGRRGIGVIAQELAAVVPEAVQANDDGLLSVAYGNLAGLLIEAVKELAGMIERLDVN